MKRFDEEKYKLSQEHQKRAAYIVRSHFCSLCIKKEGCCSRNIDNCYTARKVVKRIKNIFDKYDK